MKHNTLSRFGGLMLAILLLVPFAAEAKKSNWTVKGTIKVKHQLNELIDTYGSESPLKGVEVKIAARTKALGKWLTYASWGTVRTDANGKFSISKEKSKGDRQFKIEVKFQDADLEIRHKKSTSSLTKVKWYEIIRDAERSAGTIDFGNRVFKSGGAHDLGHFEARQHADAWTLCRAAIEHLQGMGKDFEYTTQLKVKIGHNSAVVNDSVEASYANPTTKVVYIYEKHFNASTILHEIAHIWAYNHSSGEICLTLGLLQTGDTHGLVNDHCVAFHEGFAEYFKDEMMEALFGVTTQLPYSREGLSYSYKLTNLSLVQRHDEGWRSVFHTLSKDDVHKYNFHEAYVSGGYDKYVTLNTVSRLGCASPIIGFQKVLKVFNDHPDKGYSKKLSKSDTTITAFLNRADAVLIKMTPEHCEMFANLVDPSKTGQPSDWLCGPIGKKSLAINDAGLASKSPAAMSSAKPVKAKKTKKVKGKKTKNKRGKKVRVKK